MDESDGRPRERMLTGLARRVQQLRDGYGLTLILTIVTISALAASGVASPAGGLVTLALTGVTLLFALDTSHAHPRIMRAAAALVAAALIASALARVVGDSDTAAAAALSIGLVLAAIVPIVILRHIIWSPEVTVRLVIGAVVVYLLIGLCYSYVFGILALVTGAPFFSQIADPTSAQYIYFSYTTLSTVGFGDLSAESSFGQLVSVSEALMGQLYLVSIVAVLVSNIGRPLTRSGNR